MVLLAGETAWISRRPGDGLSDDLLDNEAVLVVRVEGHWAFIRDGRGRNRRIAVTSLDAGSEYQGRSGNWYPEDHPVVQRSLERLLAKLEAERGDNAEIERVRGILNRHPETG
jgi:hypothetical protein